MTYKLFSVTADLVQGTATVVLNDQQAGAKPKNVHVMFPFPEHPHESEEKLKSVLQAEAKKHLLEAANSL